MSEINKVQQMINAKSKAKATDIKHKLMDDIYRHLDGCTYQQYHAGVLDYMPEGYELQNVTDVFAAIGMAAYEKAYNKAQKNEVDNIRDILSFMRVEGDL